METIATPYFLHNRPAKLGESITVTSFAFAQVSIPEAAVLLLNPKKASEFEEIKFGKSALSSVGNVLETVAGTLLVASSCGLVEYDRKEKHIVREFGLPTLRNGIFESPDDAQRVRFNDGKVGPNGKAYFGVIFDTSEARASRAGQAVLVGIGEDGEWKVCVEGLTTPNGGCWELESGNSFHFYLSDTRAMRINVYKHDLSTDSFAQTTTLDLSAKTWGESEETWGRPDGMTIADLHQGNESFPVLLVAMFSGGAVLIIDPRKEGKASLIGTIKVSAPKVTSVIIDGAYAYITTAQSENCPESGTTFRADISQFGITGRKFPKAWQRA